MKRLVLVLALALVLVGSASAESLATYEHTFEFSSSGSSTSGSILLPSSYFIDIRNVSSSTSGTFGTFYTYTYEAGSDTLGWHVYSDFPGVYLDGSHLTEYTYENPFQPQVTPGDTYSIIRMGLFQNGYSGTESDWNSYISFVEDYLVQLSLSCPGSYILCNGIHGSTSACIVYVFPYPGPVVSVPGFTVTMVSEVQEPFFDLFGMRGLTASFTPSNPDEDYFILFAGSDSWVGQNPDKWIWTRVHGSTDKYKIIFSGNEYTWFVRYNDEIQQYSFTYTGEEGVVPPVIVPDPEPEPPEPKPPVDTPGDIDPDIPSMPDLDSPDLTVDFTSAFDDYENMTIYQDFRVMVNGFTTSIMPDISTTEIYGYLQQVIAYLQLTMEQLREKYGVPIYNIFASVSAFVPSVCWLVVDVAIIFGMFRFMVHILTGPISTAIRERF